MVRSRGNSTAPLGLVLALAILGCARESGRCLDAKEADNPEQALVACITDFDKTDDPDYLVHAANAAAELGRSERMLEIVKMAGNSPQGADLHKLAADYLWRGGERDAAEVHFRRSVELYRELGDNSGAAASLYGLYALAWRSSDHRQALTFANESLQAALESNDVSAQVRALNGLFNVFEEVGSLGPAELVLQLVRERLGTAITPGLINAHISQGLLEMNRGRFGFAAHEFDNALAAAANSDNRSAMRGLHLNIVHANIELGRLDIAGTHMRKAWSYAEPDGSIRFALLFYQGLLHLNMGEAQAARTALVDVLDDPDVPPIWVWESHYFAGRAAETGGHIAQAKLSYRQAIAALETTRENVSLDDMKAHLLDKKRAPYEALFSLLAQEGDAVGALAIVEQVKGRSFADALIAENDEALTFSAQEIPVAQVSNRIDAIQSYIKAARESPIAVVRNVEATLEAAKNDEVLTYFSAQGRLWIIKASRGIASLHEVALNEDDLQELYSDYRANPNDDTTLAALGSALLPSEILPAPGTELFIAPDDEIGRIGIASLRVGSLYLIERHAITLIPNMNTLIAMRDSAESSSKNTASVVLGDPLGDLPNASLEADSVATYLHTVALTGREATRDQLVEGRNAKVLHLATHSGTGPLGPWFSLANGQVSMTDLMQQRLSPSLVVLASCASGDPNTKGLWGSLAGIFLSGGAKSALAALWSVPDDSTRVFMDHFYRAYREHPRASLALASAQRDAIQSGLAPREWAAFVLLGGADDR